MYMLTLAEIIHHMWLWYEYFYLQHLFDYIGSELVIRELNISKRTHSMNHSKEHLNDLTESPVGHTCIALGFIPRAGYVSGVFRLSLRISIFGDHSPYLASHVHNSGLERTTSHPWPQLLSNQYVCCVYYYNTPVTRSGLVYFVTSYFPVMHVLPTRYFHLCLAIILPAITKI